MCNKNNTDKAMYTVSNKNMDKASSPASPRQSILPKRWTRICLSITVGWMLLALMDYKQCVSKYFRIQPESFKSKHSNSFYQNPNVICVKGISGYRKSTTQRFNQTHKLGCGFTVQVDITRDNAENDINESSNDTASIAITSNDTNTTQPEPTQAFFKVMVGDDPNFHFGEWYQREIICSYLDELLLTNVVPPSIGYRIPLQPLVDTFPNVTTAAKCVLDNDPPTKKRFFRNQQHALPDTISGSLMKWTPHVATVKPEEIRMLAKQNTSITLTVADSAMRYSLFYYLAGCLKTGHNHFTIKTRMGRFYVAIDNDRCLVPNRPTTLGNASQSMYEKQLATYFFFKTVVLEDIPCHKYPKNVVQQVLKWSSASGKRILERDDNNTTVRDATSISNDNHRKLSQALRERLQEDVLADELINFQPETFAELDARIEILATRLRQCGHRLQEDDYDSNQSPPPRQSMVHRLFEEQDYLSK